MKRSHLSNCIAALTAAMVLSIYDLSTITLFASEMVPVDMLETLPDLDVSV